MSTEPPLQWQTDEADHWIANEERYLRMLEGLGRIVLDAARLEPSEAVLELGCGFGGLTLEAAAAVPGGRVIAVDISEPMLRRAQARAAEAGVTNVAFLHGDAQSLDIDGGPFDAVISRLGVMFFDDPVAAFANVARFVRSQGRLAFVCWQDVLKNEHMVVPLGAALAHIPKPDFGDPSGLGPFSLADPELIRSILAGAGWTGIAVEPFDDAMWWGRTAEDVATFIRGTGRAQILVRNADAESVQRAFEAVRDALRPFERDDGVYLGGTGWVVTAVRP